MNMQLEIATVRTSVGCIAATVSAKRPYDDVVSLNRHLFTDAPLDRGDAEALFDLERSALSTDQAWPAFFIATVTDYVVWGDRPTGRLDEGEARWLLDQVDLTRTPACFAVLVAVLDEAHDVPSWFKAAVLARAKAGWPGVFRGEDGFARAVAA